MDALAGKRVEVQREAGHERLAFSGLHLRDLSLVQHDAAHELDVEVAQADRAPARLTAEGEGIDEELVEVMAFPGLLPEGGRASAQAGVIERFELGFERVDRLGHREVALDLALVGVQKLGKDDHGSVLEVTRPGRNRIRVTYGMTGSITAREPSARLTRIWISPEFSSR